VFKASVDDSEKKRINIQRVHHTPLSNFIKNRFEHKSQNYRKKSPFKKTSKMIVPCSKINCMDSNSKATSLSSARGGKGIYQNSARTNRTKKADISIVGVSKPKSRPLEEISIKGTRKA